MAAFTADQVTRRVRFSPYGKGNGPLFALTMWDTYRTEHGKCMLGYRLNMDGKTLFVGTDFGCSPLHAIDSDDTVRALMSFLTLRPGDTDREYFDNYTPEQLEYCNQHAEYLSHTVLARFGED